MANYNRSLAIFELRPQGAGKNRKVTSVTERFSGSDRNEDEKMANYNRSLAIFEPRAMPESSAIIPHLTHIRYATGGRLSYSLRDS